MKPLYSTSATARGGRTGRVETTDGRFAYSLSMPKELGGPGGEGTNPEQLFAAGYAACFESALRLVARMQKIAVDDAAITADVSLNKTETGGFALAVALTGHLPGLSPEAARALMQAAHAVCPYSAATRGNIEVALLVA
jgi:lipoyl-dependent peroxiredoxin